MGSSKTLLGHDRMVGGMSRGARDHLIDPTQWRTSFGMRHFETQVRQIARKRDMYAVLNGHTYPLSLIVSLPAGYENFGQLVGLTDSGAFRLTATGASRLSRADGSTVVFNADGLIRRWGHTVYNNRLFFVNELNSVHYTDGASIRAVDNSPKGQYVEIFFDHVVVGRPYDHPQRFQWSGLYNFAEWTPLTHTEADFYDCAEHQVSDEGYTGVTGVRRLGPLLCVYTPSAIYVSRYVGLPRVMVTDAIVQDHGNGLPWSLAAVDRAHFFLDVRERSFFRFDGGEITEIGRPIKDFFFSDLTTNQSLQMRTFTYVDPLYKEIHWVYVSTASSGEPDREVVFNHRSGTWWTGPVEHIWSFCRGNRRSRVIDELTGTIDALTGTVDALDEASESIGRVYGSRNGRLLREEITSDTLAQLIEQPVPYLETGDYYFGDIERQKEVESMVIHSKYDDALGVDLYVASRTNIDDNVNLVLQNQLWTPTVNEQRLSFPRINGRIFRYKFVPRPTSASTITTTVAKPSSGFAALVQIPAVILPPPPTFEGMYSFSESSVGPNFVGTFTPSGAANRGTFFWVYVRKSFLIHADDTVEATVGAVQATLVTIIREPVYHDGYICLFYATGYAGGGPVGVTVTPVVASPPSGTDLAQKSVSVVGVFFNDVHQTNPIVQMQTATRVQDPQFEFPGSAQQQVMCGCAIHNPGFSGPPDDTTPFPTASPVGTFENTLAITVPVNPTYIKDGSVSVGQRAGSNTTPPIRVGWRVDDLAEASALVTWWHIAIGIRAP